MIIREHVGVDYLNVAIISILLLLVNYGVLSALQDGHEPVVIIDENDVRRLGLATSRDNIISNATSKPVVIIDENEVRRFHMPSKLLKRKRTVRPSTSNNTITTNVTINHANERNITVVNQHLCGRKLFSVARGKCFPGNASHTAPYVDDIQKTFWIPERDLDYFGDKSLETTTLLNMSENYDASPLLNDNPGVRTHGRSSDKVKNNILLKSHLRQNKTRGVSNTSIKEKGEKKQIVANSTNLGNYKVLKITNGNDTKNVKPLSTNTSVGQQKRLPLPAVKIVKTVSMSSSDLKLAQNNAISSFNDKAIQQNTTLLSTNETVKQNILPISVKGTVKSVPTTAQVKPVMKVTFTNFTIPQDTVLFGVNETVQQKALSVPDSKTGLQKSVPFSNSTIKNYAIISNINKTVQRKALTLPVNKTDTKNEIFMPAHQKTVSGKTIRRQKPVNKTVQQTSIFSPLNITDLPTSPSTAFKEEEIVSFSDQSVQQIAPPSKFNKSAKQDSPITENNRPSIKTPLTTTVIGGVSQKVASSPITATTVNDMSHQTSENATVNKHNKEITEQPIITVRTHQKSIAKDINTHTNRTTETPLLNTTRVLTETGYVRSKGITTAVDVSGVDQQRLRIPTSINKLSEYKANTTNTTGIRHVISELEVKPLPNAHDDEKLTQSNSLSRNSSLGHPTQNNYTVTEHKRLQSFFNGQTFSSINIDNKTVNPDVTVGYKKSIMNNPTGKAIRYDKAIKSISNKTAKNTYSNARFRNNTGMRKDQPIISRPVLIPKTENVQLTKINANSSTQAAVRPDKLTNIPANQAILIQFPTVRPKSRNLNQERLSNLFMTLINKKVHPVLTAKVKINVLPPGNTAGLAKTVDPIMQKKVRVLSYQKAQADLKKKKAASMKVPVSSKRLHPITSTTIKNLARNLKQHILNVWPYPNYIKTPADVMLDQGLINRAKLTISSGKRLDDVFNRAIHGEDVKIAYISSSLFRKMSVGSGKPHTLLYNQALLYWFHKVITPVTGSRLLQVKVEIPNVNEDYFSRCLENHLQHPEDINLLLWELAEMDHFPNGKLVPANRIYTENILRNMLNFSLHPEIVMIDFYRGNTLNKGKYCRQLNQDTELKLASYYDCTFLSWSKSVCPYLRDDEEGFSFSYLFSGDKRHPSVIGHAQMAYILIDFVRDAFLKYLSKNSIRPTYRQDVLPNINFLPQPIFSDIHMSLCYTTLKSLGNAQGPRNTDLRLLFIQPKDIERMGVRSSIMPNMGSQDVHIIILRFLIPGKLNEITSTTLGILPYISRPLLTMARIDDQPFLKLETGKVKRGRIMELQSTTSLKSGNHMIRFYSLDKAFNILAFTVDERRSHY